MGRKRFGVWEFGDAHPGSSLPPVSPVRQAVLAASQNSPNIRPRCRAPRQGGAAKARTRSLSRNIIWRGRRIADLQPDVLVGLRLAFDKTITGAIPGFYLVFHIVEYELANGGLDCHDR